MAQTTIDGVRYTARLVEREHGETGRRRVSVGVDGVWAGDGYWDAGTQSITDVAINAPEQAWADLDAAIAEELAEERATARRRVTDDQIRALRREAVHAGDTAQVIVCDIALDGSANLDDDSDEGSLSVSKRRELRCMTQDEAIAECASVIADARGNEDAA